MLGVDSSDGDRKTFRDETRKEYVTSTMTVEMDVHDKKLEDTELFFDIHEKYTEGLKSNVLHPLKNENFRAAVKDYDTKNFKTYDKRIKKDVEFLLEIQNE